MVSRAARKEYFPLASVGADGAFAKRKFTILSFEEEGTPAGIVNLVQQVVVVADPTEKFGVGTCGKTLFRMAAVVTDDAPSSGFVQALNDLAFDSTVWRERR